MHADLQVELPRARDPPAGRADFLDATGLADLRARTGLPERATPVGTDLGALTPRPRAISASRPATRVAAGLIDAHAGALGVLGHLAGAPEMERNLALIAGTSSCVMVLAAAAASCPASGAPTSAARCPGSGSPRAASPPPARSSITSSACTATRHPGAARPRRRPGRRAPRRHAGPRAAPARPARLSRQPLPRSRPARARRHLRPAARRFLRRALPALLAHVVAIALGLRVVVEQLRDHGQAVEALHLAGGHTRNPLLGSSTPTPPAARSSSPPRPTPSFSAPPWSPPPAAASTRSLAAAGAAMHQGGTLRPPDPATAGAHERDWRVFPGDAAASPTARRPSCPAT